MAWITGSSINGMAACANHEFCTEFLINHFHELALANNHFSELATMLKLGRKSGQHGTDLALMAWFKLLMEVHPEIKWIYSVPQYIKPV